jgi:hypothetical protein
MDIYPGFNNGLDAPSLVRMRALFAGTVIFNAGFRKHLFCSPLLAYRQS